MMQILIAFMLLVTGASTAHADPITSAITGILGAVGLGGTIGRALVQIGLSFGLSYLAKKLTPKKKTASSRGQSLNLTIDTNPFRVVPIGTVGTAGDLVYWQLSGANNKTLQMVIALADLPVDSLSSTVWIDSKQYTIGEDGYVSDHSNKLKITFHNGDPTQVADAGVISASSGRWTADEVGKYVAYAVVEATYDEKVFPSGVPQIVFVVNGAKLYDWRKDSTNGGSGSHRWSNMATWEFSNNPIVALYNIQRGLKPGGVALMGMNVPQIAMRLSDYTAAANVCDEDVALAAGGTEKRYRLSALFNTGQTNREIIETILGACGGTLVESCGIYRPMVAIAQASVAALTDADIVVGEPYITSAKRPRDELTNAVYGSYSDPTRAYNEVSLPARTSSADETADGGIRLPQMLDLTMVTSRTQAQRLMEIARRRARRQLTVSLTLRPRWFTLEPGDWITLTSERRGYTSATFEISTISIARDLTATVTMREIDAGIDDWAAGSDELADDQETDLANGGSSFSQVTGLVLANFVLEGAENEQRPGLALTWTEIDDPTVVSLQLQYRQVGETIALERQITDLSTSTYQWLDGVQGGVQYEARLIPVTLPARSTSWSAWAATSSNTEAQVVSEAAVAAVADSVVDGSITTASLSAQAALELSLNTAVSDAQGSVNARFAEITAEVQKLALTIVEHRQLTSETRARVVTSEQVIQDTNLSVAQWQTEVAAALDDMASADALLSLTSRVENTEDGIEAQAAAIVDVSTVVNGHTNSLTQITEVVGGEKRFALVASSDGKFKSLVEINSNVTKDSIAFGFDEVMFYNDAVDGGDPLQLLSLQTVDGQAEAVLNGRMIAKSFEAGEITSVQMSTTVLISPRIQNADNTNWIDLSTGVGGGGFRFG